MNPYYLALTGVMMLSTSYLAVMFIGIEYFFMQRDYLKSFLWGISFFTLFPTFLVLLIKPMRSWSNEKRTASEIE